MVRTILRYPDLKLRQKALLVDQITDQIRNLINDMHDTMYRARGIGLAATQIGEPYQIFVSDLSDPDEPSKLITFINPEITSQAGKSELFEGCLSFPGISERVVRAETIGIRAMDQDGQLFHLTFTGLMAILCQHEMDHLSGTLLIDHMSPLRRRIIDKKMRKPR